jgi:hypothetical protein
MSLKERLEEIYENLTERIRSPLIFTFIVVWSIKHWILVYALFNFEKEYTLTKKLEFIQSTIRGENSCDLFWWPLFLSFCSIILFYLLQFLAEGVGLLYKKWMRTLLYKWFDKLKLATKAEVDMEKRVNKKLNLKNKELEDRVNNYIENESVLDERIEDKEKEIEEIKLANEKQNKEFAVMNKTYQKKESEIQGLNNQIGELNRDIQKVRNDYEQLQRHEGELIENITAIFSPGEIWTCFVMQSENKMASFKFYTDKKGQFFMMNEKPTYEIRNVRIKKNVRFVEFIRAVIGNPEKSWNVILTIVNSDLLVGEETGQLVYYVKGEHDAKNKSGKLPLFFDYNSLFDK